MNNIRSEDEKANTISKDILPQGRQEENIGDMAIEYKEARPGDYSGAIVSSEKAKRELGWGPKVDFEEGVRRYIEWYKGIGR